MTIRLNKATRDLNVGITTVVEFLQKKGYDIQASPNAKITEEQYAELVKEFSTDKNLKKETEKLIQERQTKERNKTSVSIQGHQAAEAEEQEMDLRTNIRIKPLGKIDLESLNKKHSAVNEEKQKNEESPVKIEEQTEEKQQEQEEPVSLKNMEPQEMQMEKENKGREKEGKGRKGESKTTTTSADEGCHHQGNQKGRRQDWKRC